MSQVIYSVLRKRHPDALLDILAPASTIKLVQRMPEIDKGILIDQQHGQFGFGYRHGLGKHLKKARYDRAIVTQNSLKSALVPFFADIPDRIGFLGEYRYFLLSDVRLLDKKRLPLMTDRFLALVDAGRDDLVRPRLVVDEANQQQFIEQHGLAVDKPIVGFCPGAEFGDAKKWPERHYAEVAKQLIAEGKNVWIFGSPADAPAGDEIARVAGAECINLAGQTSLLDAVDLIAFCTAILTNDSGLMHVSAAVNTRVVAIYGSTSPGFTPPLSVNATILSLGLDCSPCFKRDCPLGHKNCLNQLLPDRVLSELGLSEPGLSEPGSSEL